MSQSTFSWKSGIVRKTLMSITGLFLILFLCGHLAGNLQLIFITGEDGRQAFNEYARFMTTNPAVMLLSYATYLSVLVHIAYSILLALSNRKARTAGYSVGPGNSNSSWNSRNMGVLGFLILIFLVIHLKGFWYEMKFGDLPIYNNPLSNNPNDQMTDLYTLVITSYQEWWYVLLYVVSMIVLAFHLNHGFASAFQTLGLGQKKYAPLISKIGFAFSIVVPLLFAIIPVFIFFYY